MNTMEEAKKLPDIVVFVGNVLADHYPGFMWFVEQAPGGAIVIKVQEALVFGEYGMVIYPQWPTISELKKQVIMNAGELLERCGVARGAKTESTVFKQLDGADKKYDRSQVSKNIILP